VLAIAKANLQNAPMPRRSEMAVDGLYQVCIDPIHVVANRDANVACGATELGGHLSGGQSG
jgi:hypothetical protein